jgi:hypothetical protein
MSKPSKSAAPTPAERMGRILRDSYLSAYVAGNEQHHDPEWEDAVRLGQARG